MPYSPMKEKRKKRVYQLSSSQALLGAEFEHDRLVPRLFERVKKKRW